METLVRDLESLGKAVDATNRQEIFGKAVKAVADFLVQRFGVSDAEIALLLMRPSQKVLRFAYPLEHFAGRGNLVPLNSPGVATAVVRSGRGMIHNDMSRVTRLDIFELIPIGRGKAMEIQKMIAAPLAVSGGEVIGVLEVSRKGKDLQEAGKDFTPAELTELTQIGAAVAPWFRQYTPSDF